MLYHRIDKFSRQIVCQDMILSCQPGHITEIPLFTRARINKLSLRNRGVSFGGEPFSARDLDLSGMLVKWHLCNQRGVSRFQGKSSIKMERGRVTTSERSEKVCGSLLTLRRTGLYMAIEKYLLFLMPREMTKKGIVEPQKYFFSRRKRVCLSAFYVDTALGIRQYTLANGDIKKKTKLAQWKVLSPERVCFPHMENSATPFHAYVPCKKRSFKESYSDEESKVKKPFFAHSYYTKDQRLHNLKLRSLSLYCPSVLNSPDIQDIAQSGLITLEGHFVLELS